MKILVPSIQSFAYPLHHCIPKSPIKIIQANSWDYVATFMRVRPAGYMVSIPTDTTQKVWEIGKEGLVGDNFCVPLVHKNTAQTIAWAHEKGQRLLIDKILADFGQGMNSIRFTSVEVFSDRSLELAYF